MGALRRVLGCSLGAFAWCHTALAQAPGEAEVTSRIEPSTGELSLSVGARLDRGDTRSGVLGFAALNVPLERFVNAPRVVSPPGSDAGADAPGTEGAEPVSAPGAAESPRPFLSAAELSRLAREAVAASLRASGAPLRSEELERVASRARLSAALPELRVRGQRSDDESLRLTPSTEDPYRYSVSGGRDWLLEAQLTFRLSRLVFADEELAVERVRIERERTSARTAAHVVERVLRWHRALTLSRDAELSPEVRQKLALDALDAEVELDVLTGAWFGERTARYHEPALPDEPRSGPKAPPAPNAPTTPNAPPAPE